MTLVSDHYVRPYKTGHMNQPDFLVPGGTEVTIISSTPDYYNGNIVTLEISVNGRRGFIGGGYNQINGWILVKS